MNDIIYYDSSGDWPGTINKVNFRDSSNTLYENINAVYLKTAEGTQKIYGKPCSIKFENSEYLTGNNISGYWGDEVDFECYITVPEPDSKTTYGDIQWDSPEYFSTKPAEMSSNVWNGAGYYSVGYRHELTKYYRYSVFIERNGKYYDEFYGSTSLRSTYSLTEPENVFTATLYEEKYDEFGEFVTVYGGKTTVYNQLTVLTENIFGCSLGVSPKSGNYEPGELVFIGYDLYMERDAIGSYTYTSVYVALFDNEGNQITRSYVSYSRPDNGGWVAMDQSLSFTMPDYSTTVTVKVVAAG